MVRSLIAAAAVFCVASAASAATLTYTGRSTGSTAITGFVQETPLANGQGVGNVAAAGFDMTDTSGSLGSFVAWCLDLQHRLQTTADYVVTSTPFSYFTVPTARIQALFDANYSSVDPTNVVQSAAFQLALWEALYDTDWSLTAATAGPEFRAAGAERINGVLVFDTPQSQAINATAAGYLTAASTYTGGARWSVTYLESQSNSQSLVTVSPVPVPAAALLLLSSLGALALWRRRVA